MGDGDGDGVIPYETFSVGNLKDGNNEIEYVWTFARRWLASPSPSPSL